MQLSALLCERQWTSLVSKQEFTSLSNATGGGCPRPRSQRQITVSSYQNGSQPFGNTASGSNRAALTETIDAPIDVSREVVTTQTVPLPGVRKSYRVSFFDAMKFNGPAPEKINGRLAMLGFLLGSVNEARTAMPVVDQAREAPVLVAVVVVLFSWASLIPIMKGARSEAFGVFTPRAELTNGRAAMLGMAVLLFLERTAGVAFF